MEIIRFADLKAEAWHNGGGVTRQIAGQASPAAASTAVPPGGTNGGRGEG